MMQRICHRLRGWFGMVRLRGRIGLVLLAAVGLAAVGLAAAPVPEEAEQQTLREEIRGLFEKEYAKRDGDARKQLARLLFREAQATSDDSAARYVLLDEAREQATLGGDVDFTFRVMDRLGEQYEVDAVEMALDALPMLGRTLRSAEEHERVVERAMMVVETAVRQSRYEDALRLVPIIRGSAVKSRNRDLTARVNDLTQRLNRMKVEYGRLADARQTLADAPEDAEANHRLGTFHAFTEGDWEKALPHLRHAAEAPWPDLAESDLAMPGDPSAQAGLAERYWQQAEQAEDIGAREAFRALARHWYRRALPGLSGLTRKVAAERAAGDDAIDLGRMKLLPGLSATYYHDYRFENEADATIDATVSHDWGVRVPRQGVSRDFAVRWVGWLKAPESGWYDLATEADDWARVEVEGQRVLEGRQSTRGRAYLIKGYNALRVSFIDYGGAASLRFRWQRPGEEDLSNVPDSAFFYDLASAPTE